MPATLEPPTATHTDETPVPELAPWMVTVGDLWDHPDNAPVCVARVRTGGEYQLARHLAACRVPYYLPIERVAKWYDIGGRRTKKKSFRTLLPGFVTVGGGQDGRDALAGYRSRHPACGYGYLPVGARLQRVYRDEIERLAAVACAGSAVRPDTVLQPGKMCVVVTGAFRGMVGELLREESGGCFAVVLSVLGQRVPTTIPIEYLETY